MRLLVVGVKGQLGQTQRVLRARLTSAIDVNTQAPNRHLGSDTSQLDVRERSEPVEGCSILTKSFIQAENSKNQSVFIRAVAMTTVV